jgi:hypothetical protein
MAVGSVDKRRVPQRGHMSRGSRFPSLRLVFVTVSALHNLAYGEGSRPDPLIMPKESRRLLMLAMGVDAQVNRVQ